MAVIAISPEMMWAIGIFEGEGSIIISNNRGSVNLVVQMSDQDVLERFFGIVDVGTLKGPYKPKGPKADKEYKVIWKWQSNSIVNTKTLLELWIPYLGNRRKRRAIDALLLLRAKTGRKPRLVCFKGHPWTPYNTWTSKKTGFRTCKACRKLNLEVKSFHPAEVRVS